MTSNPNELEQRLLAFQQRYEVTASPFPKIENKRLASLA
jgi:hypothetical protein